MHDGETYEAYEVARHILKNKTWMNKLKAMNESNRYGKVDGYISPACRELKLKLSVDEWACVRWLVYKEVKELA